MAALRSWPAGLALAMALSTSASAEAPQPAYIHAHSATARLDYLANATIWRDPGDVTVDAVRHGPPGLLPGGIEAGIECRFDRPGRLLGGKTPKFVCRTSDGRALRLKYYDGTPAGNREVFAAVAATRLMAALGFNADPTYAVRITCLDCPANPFTGEGPVARREYVGTYEPRFSGTLIASGTDPDQGWSFGELGEAIDRLPAGEVRTRQRMHFDALTLLAVFLQHGDRKPSQQRLACQGTVEPGAGDMHDVSPNDSRGHPLPVLFERPASRACTGESVATLQDVGATFGAAGQVTHNVTSKMHLTSWARVPVFGPPSDADLRRHAGGRIPCYGRLTSSGTAGEGARDNPRIGDAGRAFLAAQFARLTPDHIRALFEAARVTETGDPNVWRDRGGAEYRGVDAWTAVFSAKVREITQATCAP